MTDEAPWLIVGLGNPGPKYAGNRHNVGAMVVERMAADAGASLRAHKAGALAAQVRVAGQAAIIAIPTSYMNESGGPVAGLMRFFKVPLEHLIVIHDELDIDFATLRLKRGGGEGGHNGLRSISKSTGSKDYLRVRVGIGRPPGRMDAASYVLRDFNGTERKELDFLVPDTVEAVELLLTKGLTDAQNVIHAR
ncbi:peptidyl-tRNA hydrolase [Flexivirga endophytica]|uniref:Peptidyl-tRNA hydrolase n=1 Tax=Flexivirga endophytica TaxID=1849103 RepID=A0A916TJE4_9MICO|nr:aminoacyl-tRNA hydrolase [Flexivirga endophytica]GGB48096.1 peptidyl-tRNA hydrolase [Flexivirga endophytica]GHB61039.1 peptidyl-tRNA hydrolase [Flexivirga endophytica]